MANTIFKTLFSLLWNILKSFRFILIPLAILIVILIIVHFFSPHFIYICLCCHLFFIIHSFCKMSTVTIRQITADIPVIFYILTKKCQKECRHAMYLHSFLI